MTCLSHTTRKEMWIDGKRGERKRYKNFQQQCRELQEALDTLNKHSIETEKIKMIKLQIRKLSALKKKKVLFSIARKPKTFQQLKVDFLELLQYSPEQLPPPEKRQRIDYNTNPDRLVGERIRHKFLTGGNEEWYEGYVIAYNSELKEHEIIYSGDTTHYHYNLLEDIEDGSLHVL